MKAQLVFTTLMAALLAACNTAPRPVATENQSPIRKTALQFATALKSADSRTLESMTTHETDPEIVALSQKTLADAVKGREVQIALQQHFGTMETRPGVCGTSAWTNQLEQTAENEPIMQAGNRVRIGEAGKPGTFFLREVDGTWKVEAVPTLIAENGGRVKGSDPTLDYRLGVTLAVNAWMLERLDRGEFASMHDFMAAKSQFWFEFMACAANGDDPREKLLSSLPPLPVETNMVAEDR